MSIDRADHGLGIGAVRLDGDRPDAERLRRLSRLVGLVGLADVGQRDVCALASEPLTMAGAYNELNQ